MLSRGLGSLAMAALAAFGAQGCRRAAEGPSPAPVDVRTPVDVACRDCNLLIVSVDTLRADRLGCYGHNRQTSPFIDGLARTGVVFERAQSASFHTADSHMSLFTSLPPSVHGVRNMAQSSQYRVVRLPGHIPTLAERLRERGFVSAGFHGGGNVSGAYGFDRGFDVYRNSKGPGQVEAWLEEVRERRFFLFFHTYRPHDPYLPGIETVQEVCGADFVDRHASLLSRLPDREESAQRKFAERRERFWSLTEWEDQTSLELLNGLYDASVREADAEVEAVVSLVLARAPRTMVVLLSDHGEEFREHGRFLHGQLYQESLHVPLIVHFPGRELGWRVAAPVHLMDVGPTVIDLLAGPPPPLGVGRSLVATMHEPARDDRALVSEKVDFGRSILVADKKLVELADGRVELYDLLQDPRESVDLSAARQKEVRRLQQLLRATVDGAVAVPAESPAEGEVDEEMRQELEALGYLR